SEPSPSRRKSCADSIRPIGASRFCAHRQIGYSRNAHRKVATRMWRSGSASPCQGEGREFESRHPLEEEVSWFAVYTKWTDRTPGGVAERRGSGLQSRIHGFESRRHLTPN